MSTTHGRPKSSVLPLGGKARSATGGHLSTTHGRPKSGLPPLGESAHCAKGVR